MKANHTYKFNVFLSLFLLCVFSVTDGLAQENKGASKEWNYLVQPYILLPNIVGTTGLGTLPNAQIDANTGDIFSNLKMAAMLYLEANNGKWTASSDILYMHLGKGVNSGVVINSGEVDVKQLAWELAGLYRINPWLEVGAGFRLNNITNELNLNLYTIGSGLQNVNRKMSDTWVDPILITRVQVPYKDWSFSFRGDIGGFGIGSDFAWQAQGDVGYNFSKLFQLAVGYRYISMDYESGSGNNRFLYDMDTFGPTMKFGFRF